MNPSAMSLLPEQWQAWIVDGLTAGCTPAVLAGVMVKDGKIRPALARAAIEETRRAGFAHLPEVPFPQRMPDIDTETNRLRLPDREVKILMSVRMPRIVLIGDLLSDEECDALIEYGHTRLERARLVSHADGSPIVDAQRTASSAGMWCVESDLVARVEARLAALTRWPVERGETMQLLQYRKDEQYRPHHDWFNPAKPGGQKQIDRGGQRLSTIIMYLSDVERGGCTSFPLLDMQVYPQKGSALFFANTNVYGVPDEQTFHGGEPVVQGVKYVASKWQRQHVPR